MILTFDNWKSMLETTAHLFQENEHMLSELDARIGDGDHGITVSKIGGLILDECAAASDTAGLFKAVGKKLRSLPGGSACPLYGTFFGGFARGVGEGDCDAAMVKAMFQAAFDKLDALSGAKVGDKTMMDALIPANEAIQAGGDDVRAFLRAAADAAKAGSDKTKEFTSKFGRAKSYGERTLGYADPGSVSMALVFEGFARAVEAL